MSFNEERKVVKPKITDDEKARRRKDVLKDLEVCDMLDLRNPQSVSEYAPSILISLMAHEKRFALASDFLSKHS